MAGAMPKLMMSAERIELAAEFAGGVGHARDASVEPVHHRREADGFRGDFEILRREAWIGGEIHDTLNGADDRQKAEKNIARGKERRQRIGRARRSLARTCFP